MPAGEGARWWRTEPHVGQSSSARGGEEAVHDDDDDEDGADGAGQMSGRRLGRPTRFSYFEDVVTVVLWAGSANK